MSRRSGESALSKTAVFCHRPASVSYRVADETVLVDRAVPELSVFKDSSGRVAEKRTEEKRTVPHRAVAPATIFAGEARVGSRLCQLRCTASPAQFVIAVAGAGSFAVDRGASRIEAEPEGASRAASGFIEALLGPALVLALACRGVFALHASAVWLRHVGVVALAGESGAGKSTLARLLAARYPDARLVADDILAVSRTDDGEMICARPHFPQLKLDRARMRGITALPARLPLAGIYEIEARRGAQRVRRQPGSPREATVTLVRHTVGSRLFDPPLLAGHLAFCCDAAARTRVGRLVFPRRKEIAAAVRREIEAGLRQPGS